MIRFPITCRRLSGIFAVLAVCLANAIPVLASDASTTRYFEQLRRRGLFQLAEGVCRRELAREGISPETRSQYTLEFSRTLTEQAKYAVGVEQTKLWKRATGVIDRYLKSTSNTPRRKWLEIQRVIVRILQGEFRRWDAELSPQDKTAQTEAAGHLNEALRTLQQLERALSGANSVSDGSGIGTKSQRASERQLLLRHIRYQSAIAYVHLAELAPPGSADRKNRLVKAAALLGPLAKLRPGSPIAWNSRLLAASVLRLQTKLRAATDRLEVIRKLKPPPPVRRHIETELVKILLAKDLTSQADRILRALQSRNNALPGELAYLKVKTSVSLWRDAAKNGNTKRAAELLKQAEREVKTAEKNLGGYWSYRCRVLFDFLKESRIRGPKLAAALRKAQASFTARQWAAAAGDYAAAAKLAFDAGDRKLFAKLMINAGSIHYQAGDYPSAAAVYRRVAKTDSKNPRAAEADVMAAYCLGRHYDSLRTKRRREAYAKALAEHRRNFPQSPTIHEAAWMLATLHEYRGQTSEALKLYLTIPAKHPRGSLAQLSAARSYETIISRLRELKKPKDRVAWEAHAITRLDAMTAEFPKSPALLDSAQTEIAMRTARIHLNRSRPGYRPAALLLKRVIASAEASRKKTTGKKSARRFWSSSLRAARRLSIVAFAGTGKYAQAKGLLADLDKAEAAEVMAVLDGLMQIKAGTDPSLRYQLGSLQLQTAKSLNRIRAKLKPAEQKWLDRSMAQIYAAMGRTDQAIRHWKTLLGRSPRNRTLLTRVATLLESQTDRTSLLSARKHWRTLESLAKPGKNGWLTARYHIARCSYRIAEFAECRKLLTVTKLLYPRLGGKELRGKFESLLKDVNRKLRIARN